MTSPVLALFVTFLVGFFALFALFFILWFLVLIVFIPLRNFWYMILDFFRLV